MWTVYLQRTDGQSSPYSVSGVTPLHIAVVNQNINLVHHLISRGGDAATPRVTGLYFRKRIGGLIYYGQSACVQEEGWWGWSYKEHHIAHKDCLGKNWHVNAKKMVFFKMCIWSTGEHILSFAACAGNEDIITMVIDAGASTRVQDYRGRKHLLS